MGEEVGVGEEGFGRREDRSLGDEVVEDSLFDWRNFGSHDFEFDVSTIFAVCSTATL